MAAPPRRVQRQQSEQAFTTSPSGQPGRWYPAATDALQVALRANGHQVALVCLARATADLPRWQALLVRAQFLWDVALQLLLHRPQELVVCHLNLAPIARWLHSRLGLPYRVLLHGLEVQALARQNPSAAGVILVGANWCREFSTAGLSALCLASILSHWCACLTPFALIAFGCSHPNQAHIFPLCSRCVALMPPRATKVWIGCCRRCLR